ncbi:MAG: hypothetical protein J7M06_03955 [Proteobacteria bacterium]|nr:hypothetical protein [Pseudomonadota bacterium]
MRNVSLVSIMIFLSFFLGCHSNGKLLKRALVPTDVQIMRYHVKEDFKSLEEFTRRLYLKNPKYEKDLEMRKKKIRRIFQGKELLDTGFNNEPSHKVLEAAFEADSPYEDRVFLLSLGLTKSIREAYNIEEGLFLSSMEVSLEKLEKLYHNISHVNWRLKVYCDEQGNLLFLTNEPGEEGYINMGYEVIMTEIMTRIKDDIFLRGGTPPKLFFNMSTLFLSILIF